MELLETDIDREGGYEVAKVGAVKLPCAARISCSAQVRRFEDTPLPKDSLYDISLEQLTGVAGKAKQIVADIVRDTTKEEDEEDEFFRVTKTKVRARVPARHIAHRSPHSAAARRARAPALLGALPHRGAVLQVQHVARRRAAAREHGREAALAHDAPLRAAPAGAAAHPSGTGRRALRHSTEHPPNIYCTKPRAQPQSLYSTIYCMIKCAKSRQKSSRMRVRERFFLLATGRTATLKHATALVKTLPRRNMRRNSRESCGVITMV